MRERNIAACFKFNYNIVIDNQVHTIMLIKLNIFPKHRKVYLPFNGIAFELK